MKNISPNQIKVDDRDFLMTQFLVTEIMKCKSFDFSTKNQLLTTLFSTRAGDLKDDFVFPLSKNPPTCLRFMAIKESSVAMISPVLPEDVPEGLKLPSSIPIIMQDDDETDDDDFYSVIDDETDDDFEDATDEVI